MSRAQVSHSVRPKTRSSLAFAVVAVLGGVASTGVASRASRPPSPDVKLRLMENYGKLPLHFEANEGQTDERVRFLARGSGYGLFLTPTESVLVLRKTGAAVLRMKLLGANPRPVVAGREELPGKSNYFIGSDPKKWRTIVPQYARVEYEDVYPGVSLAYYGNQGQIEYDFVVRPGADPGQIRFGIEEADAVRVDGDGNLVMSLPDGEVVERAPIVYQEVDGARKAIDGRFVLRGPREVGFEVGAYQRDRPLVLDPLLVYSTYLGGNDFEMGLGIAVDTSGNAYVIGGTSSTDFPTTSAFQGVNGGGIDVFVAKLDAAGSALVYSTYVGGSADEYARDIAVDPSGSAYLTGWTLSNNYPTASPLQATNGGGFDAFVTKLDATGSTLVYSTYLGGSATDQGLGIAVDSGGNAYVTGETDSSAFPTSSPLQAASGGFSDAFVAKLNPAGSAFVYSTYLGGSLSDLGTSVAVDASGSAYVTGWTGSSNFPTANPLQAANAGGLDAFVTKLNAAGSALVYSTYLGGSAEEQGWGIAVDTPGNAYVSGSTVSPNFPTANAIQASNGGSNDAYVAKLNAAGSALVYSSYLGGSAHDNGFRVAVDSSGSAYVTGNTDSTDFPAVKPLQGANGGTFDAFATKLNAAGSAIVYATYLGGTNFDQGIGIAVDAAGNAYVVGHTQSSDFPTSRSLQAALRGSDDAFVTKIGPGTPPPGDFNADGKVDLLWRDQGNTGHIAVWFMNGATKIGAHLTDPSPFPILSWRIVGTGDFDGDGRTDILWRDEADAGWIAVWLMDGTRMKSATLTDPSSFPLLNWQIVGVGDFNGDGKPDILWRETRSTGQLAVWFMDGTTKTGATLLDPSSFPLLNWQIQAVGDFDGDGKPDIVWREQGSVGWIAIWFMDGITRKSATLTSPSAFPIQSWSIVGPK